MGPAACVLSSGFRQLSHSFGGAFEFCSSTVAARAAAGTGKWDPMVPHLRGPSGPSSSRAALPPPTWLPSSRCTRAGTSTQAWMSSSRRSVSLSMRSRWYCATIWRGCAFSRRRADSSERRSVSSCTGGPGEVCVCREGEVWGSEGCWQGGISTSVGHRRPLLNAEFSWPEGLEAHAGMELPGDAFARAAPASLPASPPPPACGPLRRGAGSASSCGWTC